MRNETETPPTSSPVEPAPTSTAANSRERALRLRRVNRDQIVPIPAHVDALLAADHLARLIWQAVEQLDLSAFYSQLVVVEDGPGRAAVDPQILVALWLYATTQGVTSARALNRLCVEHLAYIWLCGGVSMNYHTLSDFRVQQRAALDDLMTQVLGRLLYAGLIKLEHVSQDGMRVRASAGASSFRRRPTLTKCLTQAREYLQKLEADASESDEEDDQEPPSNARRAARARAAREQVARLEAALAEMPAAEEAKPKADREKARVSSTDVEARVMKMPDGGYRPAYNLQFASDTAEQVIVGVSASNVGSDMGQAPDMLEQVMARLQQRPRDWLMDGGFASRAAIEYLEQRGVRVLAPVQQPKDPARDPYQPLPTDAPQVAAWRQRMGTEEAKVLYRLRAATSECVNAHARQHGLTQLRVRGLCKVLCVALWSAIAHNLLVWLRTGLTPGADQPVGVT